MFSLLNIEKIYNLNIPHGRWTYNVHYSDLISTFIYVNIRDASIRRYGTDTDIFKKYIADSNTDGEDSTKGIKT